LCNENIEWVNEIKYLRIKVNDKLNYKDYIHEKRMSAFNAIKFIGLETKEMEPKLKAHMFKC
jgi:hypothetical protein